MILKHGMKHQAMEFYNVYINPDPWMTLTYFIARSTKVAHAFEWGKLLKCHLMGKTYLAKIGKWTAVLCFQKEIDSRGCSAPALGLYTCILLSSQTSLLIYISGLR